MQSPEKNFYTADEFFSFAETNSTCMELFDGEIVYQASPSTLHQRLVMRISYAISSYIQMNKGKCEIFPAPYDVRLDDFNVVIPDISVICDSSKITDKRCEGAPDWIIEIVSSNRYDDFYRKLALYKKSNVREYWIVDPEYKKTLVYFFEENDFPEIYAFEQSILVNIYKNNPVKLSINIEELIR